jgi:hypothetical protein
MSHTSPFSLELDHLTLFTATDAPEADALRQIGLADFGGVTQHDGLGTASLSFFFANLLYLELFWVTDAELARQMLEPLSMDVNARMNWRATGAVPFGLMLRRRVAGSNEPPPFPTRPMRAPWMPEGTFVGFSGEVAGEPYYGVVPEALSFRGFRANIQDVPHPLGVQNLTAVSVTLPSATLSPIAQLLNQHQIVALTSGPEPLMVLTFDEGQQGQTMDMRPTLPLVLKV